jgi:hypothetical protein
MVTGGAALCGPPQGEDGRGEECQPRETGRGSYANGEDVVGHDALPP